MFSLKWKALGLTSLALITGAAALTLLSFHNLTRQAAEQREALHQRDVREIRATLSASLRRLQQLAALVPGADGMRQALADGSRQAVEQSFEASDGPRISLDWDVDQVHFFGAGERLVASWQGDWLDPGAGGTIIPEVEIWAGVAQRQERPVHAVACRPVCSEYVAAPVLLGGGRTGAVVLGASAADLVLGFQGISGNDIGLLVPAMDGYSDENAIGNWPLRVVALSDRGRRGNDEFSMPLLRAVADAHPPDAMISSELQFPFRDRDLEIRLIPLTTLAPDPTAVVDQDVQVVVISDITDSLANIRNSTREIALVGGFGWLAAEVLLMLLLWAPMSRVRRLADQLPLLADGEFAQVRRAIGESARRAGMHDETDVLQSTAVALSHQLEALETEVEDRNQALSRRMEELSRERDFVTSLLDTAQVIILTQDRDGRITRVNRCGEQLTGFREREVLGREFMGLLSADGLMADIRGHLSDLAAGRRESLRHDSIVPCRDGSMRSVVWYHSQLSERHGQEAAVLSVGLDVTDRKLAENRLSWLAEHDSLTGLFNRRRFQQELEGVMSSSLRTGRSAALLVFDLDQFKLINDTSGHHAGDALLKVVADVLTHKLGAADTVARMGGDEFALLIRDADARRARSVADELQKLLSEIEFPVRNRQHRVSASMGIARLPEHADTVGDLLACADLAMYEAKEGGRGRAHFFDATDRARERMQRRVYWKHKVERALAEDRFVLYFQPILDIALGTVSHFEVLLRMKDDQGGVIPPGDFIEAAERCGLIHQVDRMVMNRALAHMAALQRRGREVTFSVNLSAHALGDSELLPFVRKGLEKFKVSADNFIFEVTETAAVADFKAARELMLGMREFGCHFALDDFGVGFSSFYYLKELPIDYVKIDGSFIRDLSKNPDDQILVRALTQVAEGFGKVTIAEFVEDARTLDLIREFGVNYAQGYHVGRPQPAREAFRAVY